MKLGTKSLLYGAHCFLLHPWFVAAAWTRIYGFPFDPRLWIAFFVHDLGYLGKPNMDGTEGQTHVELGATIMRILFGKPWGDFTRYHSRFYAKRDGRHFSRLCVADKLALSLTPPWLYLPMVRRTGEIQEYKAVTNCRITQGEPQGTMPASTISQDEQWYAQIQEYARRWAETHKDGRTDTWTPVPIQSTQHLAHT